MIIVTTPAPPSEGAGVSGPLWWDPQTRIGRPARGATGRCSIRRPTQRFGKVCEQGSTPLGLIGSAIRVTGPVFYRCRRGP